ncbi:MAG: PEP-utilizing enzyme [Nanoarchaeota archaeon]
MVQALIEIDDETNKILNLVKVKQGLKDKGQVIEYIVNKYKLETDQPDMRYQNDGDKWMLAEDIPDMDFFFSQIWLSCFVDNFMNSTGKAYKKILCVYKGYHLLFYFGEKDSYEVGENIVQRFLNEPEFANIVNKNIVNWADRLREYSESIPERNLEKLSNAQLWEIYENHNKIHTEYYEWAWIPVAADMFHDNLTNRLKDALRAKGLTEEQVNESFVILTSPTEKSLIQVEQEEFLQIALNIEKDEYHRKLFEKLYKSFKEQEVAKFGYQTHTKEYEELLEQKVGELVSHIKPNVLEGIKNHYKKYFYVNHMWVGKASTLEHYLKELVKLIANHSDNAATLKDIDDDFQITYNKRKSLLKELKLDKNWESLFDEFGKFMITKIYRRFAQIYAVYKMEFILNEIARRFEISLKQARFMTPAEAKQALLQGKIDKEIITDREKLCVGYAEFGKKIIYTGTKAQELVRSVQQVNVQDVSEIKGQTACMGKATGHVKIVIRPSDMHKMNKGDILVSIATDPDIVSAMKKAAAIVTEQGGVTSHAAIVSRELNIPCVIGTKIATKVLKDGDLIEVDASKGTVKILKRA